MLAAWPTRSRDAGTAGSFFLTRVPPFRRLSGAIGFNRRPPYTQCIVQVRISFDPRLDVTVEEFAAQWRGSPENLAMGEIAEGRMAPSAGTFSEPATAIAILTTILLGVSSNAIWAAIQATYRRLCASRNQPAKSVELQHIQCPDGTEITILRLKE
jgi:hypothetical protein